MRLFSWFKSNTFESMDELEQMDLADGLGIIDIKNDIQSIKKRLTDLEENSNWKDNIITAKEAAWRLQQIEEETLPKELNNAFATINETINNEQDSLILFEYTKEYEDNWCTTYNMVRAYHIKRLAEALRKYGYRVDVYGPKDEYGLRIKIHLRNEEGGLEFSKIDPDKKYILPMERTTTSDYMRNYAYYNTGHWLVSGGALDDDWAERSGYTVYGKDILDAPDWVKAIKPIEVEE